MKIISKIGRIFLFILYFMIIAAGITVIILLITGRKLYCIETGSMEPDYPVGSMVVVENTDFEQLKVGDVITFVISDNTVVTHRLIGIDPETRMLTTKGDNNQIADSSPVSGENVIGRVIAEIPYAGYVFMLLSTRFGKIMLGIIIFGIIGIIFIKRIYYKAPEEHSSYAEPAAQVVGKEHDEIKKPEDDVTMENIISVNEDQGSDDDIKPDHN